MRHDVRFECIIRAELRAHVYRIGRNRASLHPDRVILPAHVAERSPLITPSTLSTSRTLRTSRTPRTPA